MTPGLPLHESHAALGAHFTERDGRLLPAHYGDTASEARALRDTAAFLDCSEQSRFLVTGTDALAVLSSAFAGPLEGLAEGRATGSCSLTRDGCIEDLVTITRTGGIAYLVSGEPGVRDSTLRRLNGAAKPGYDARVEDRTETTCAVSVIGPAAEAVVAAHVAPDLPGRLPGTHCLPFAFHGFRALVTRAGAGGEDGFAFVLAPSVARHLVETLHEHGVVPAGRDAREILRVEACIPAVDPDLLPGLSPAEADLDTALGVPGGRQACSLAAVLCEGSRIFPAGTPVSSGTAVCGETRSCVRSPALDAVIMLAILKPRYASPGTPLHIVGTPASVVGKPFYRRRGAGGRW